MNAAHSPEKTSEAPAAITRLSDAARRASSSRLAPSRRAASVPPPTPNRLAAAIVIR